MTLLICAAVFLAVFLGIFTINLALTDLFKQDRSAQLKELEAELRQQMREHARSVAKQSDLFSLSQEGGGPKPFSIIQMIKRFRQMTDQAGLKTDPQKIGFFGLAGGSLFAVAVYFLTSSVILAVVIIAVGAILPVMYILQKRQQRLDAMSEQLPDALELMGRILRSGQTITQALNGVGDEFNDPIGTEFGFCYEQQNLGLPLEVALRSLVERTGLIEIKILVMAIIIQRQAGGNLAELLDKLSDVMRQRHTLRGTVRTLTAEGRMQANFLVGLPFFAWVAMLFLNRQYALKLLEHPTLIYSTMGLMALGMLWIRRIVNFDF